MPGSHVCTPILHQRLRPRKSTIRPEPMHPEQDRQGERTGAQQGEIPAHDHPGSQRQTTPFEG